MKKNKDLILFSQFFEYLGWFLFNIQQGKKFPVKRAFLSGSRKSGKTKAIANFIASLNCLNSKTRVYAIMKTVKGLQDGVLGEIETAIEQAGHNIIQSWAKPWRIKLQNVDIKFMNLFSKNDSKANLKGLAGNDSFDNVVVWIEEADQISEQEWVSILEAVRGCDNVLYLTSSNPLSKYHWLCKYVQEYLPFNLAKIKRDLNIMNTFDTPLGKILIHYSCLEGNNLLPEDIKIESHENARFRAPGLRDTVIWGAPGQEEGLIYTDAMRLINLNKPSRKADILYGGVDFGYTRDATAGIIFGVDRLKQKRMVVREFVHNNKIRRFVGDEQQKAIVKFFVESYRELYGDGWLQTIAPMWVYCDYADKTMIYNLNQELDNNPIYNDVKRAIVFLETVKIPINERIDKVREEMVKEILEIDAEKCPNLMMELDMAKWADKEGQVERQRLDGNDHSINALEYAMTNTW